jgi:hypothetical protein
MVSAEAPNEQYSTPRLIDPTTLLEPEKRLMLAVLEGAVRDFKTYAMASTGRGKQIFIDADRWLDARPMGPFAFENICHAVGLDPDFIRDGLRRWRAAQRFQPTVVALSVRLRAAG